MNEMSLGAVARQLYFLAQTRSAHVVFVFFKLETMWVKGDFGECIFLATVWQPFFLAISIKQSGFSNGMCIVMVGNFVAWFIVIVPCLVILLCILLWLNDVCFFFLDFMYS